MERHTVQTSNVSKKSKMCPHFLLPVVYIVYIYFSLQRIKNGGVLFLAERFLTLFFVFERLHPKLSVAGIVCPNAILRDLEGVGSC